MDVEDFEEFRRKYLDQIRESELPPIPEKYKNLPDITSLVVSKDDFQDLELAAKVAIKLTVLTKEEICRRGRSVFSKMQSGVSRRDIANLFLLTFQLKVPRPQITSRVFPEKDPLENTLDVDAEAFDDKVLMSSGEEFTITEGSNINDNANAYSFLAAAFLRLFTKSPENFVLAWNHIVRGYQTFYSKPCPVAGINPTLRVVKIIHGLFSRDSEFKMTLYRILYMSNMHRGEESLKRFLYDIHLTHTGMHIVPIFCRLCIALNCNTGTLLHAIRSREYNRQLVGLSKVINYITDRSDEHKYQMWRYGRIFDPTFMSVLQTRACPKLVAILAQALKLERPEEAADIMKIKQLDNVSEIDREKCRTSAMMLLEMIKGDSEL